MITAVKIKTYRLQKQGARGFAICVPKSWLDDMELRAGDSIDLLRDLDDQLILKAVRKIEAGERKVGAD